MDIRIIVSLPVETSVIFMLFDITHLHTVFFNQSKKYVWKKIVYHRGTENVGHLSVL